MEFFVSSIYLQPRAMICSPFKCTYLRYLHSQSCELIVSVSRKIKLFRDGGRCVQQQSDVWKRCCVPLLTEIKGKDKKWFWKPLFMQTFSLYFYLHPKKYFTLSLLHCKVGHSYYKRWWFFIKVVSFYVFGFSYLLFFHVQFRNASISGVGTEKTRTILSGKM